MGIETVRVRVCLHVPSLFPSPSPSKFNIVPMETVCLTGRMGTEPILSIKRPISIDTMLNFDGDGDGHGVGDGASKQALKVCSYLTFFNPFNWPFFYCPLNGLIGLKPILSVSQPVTIYTMLNKKRLLLIKRAKICYVWTDLKCTCSDVLKFGLGRCNAAFTLIETETEPNKMCTVMFSVVSVCLSMRGGIAILPLSMIPLASCRFHRHPLPPTLPPPPYKDHQSLVPLLYEEPPKCSKLFTWTLLYRHPPVFTLPDTETDTDTNEKSVV